MLRIGIDNGADGGIVALDGGCKVVNSTIMPVMNVGVTRKGKDGKSKPGKKRVLDMRVVVTLLRELHASDPDVYAVLEHAQTFPGEGLSTAFNAGRSYGAMEMALVAAGIPYDIVRPRRWQMEVLKGVEGTDTKARAILRCQRAVPDLPLTWGRKRKPHTGLADAACMALYGMIVRQGA
tara:strand:+ start:247 stop:783 length:537 start_codon:yes stop_codon:yes gene_type:complete